MSKILTLALRPHRLSDLIGQKTLVEAIRNQVAARVPHAWMFIGGTGTGKTTIARILAISLQCTHQTVWGDPCEACRKRTGFCIHEINCSKLSGVEEMNRIADMSVYKPSTGKYRVIILDEAQRASSAGQNLLLKPFEDAPSTTVWIICTTDPGKILATLRRRCMTYQVKSLSMSGCEALLKRAAKSIALKPALEPLIEAVHEAVITSPALVLMALEKYAAGAPAREAALGDAASVDTLRICKAVIAGNWNDLRGHLDLATPEDSRYIRASVCGYLRGCLNRENDHKRRMALADSMIDLTSMAPLEDSMLGQWVFAMLYKVTRRFKQ